MGEDFDFRRQSWGHAIHMPTMHERVVNPPWWRKLLGAKPQRFEYLSCMGHCTPMPWNGDALLIPMQSGKTARFRVIESHKCSGVDDMFEVSRADFEGYLEDATP